MAITRALPVIIVGLTTFAVVPIAPALADGGELAFLPNTMTVTLLNEGGKYVVVDMKKIEKGETCRLEKDSVIVKIGPGETSGTTKVRYAAPQLSSGGCPLLTEFELPDATYLEARAEFEKSKEEASNRVEGLKKKLGEKWDEFTGAKK